MDDSSQKATSLRSGTSSEEWRPVVGYEGWYEVSDRGGIRSVTRILNDGRRWPGRVMTPGKLPPRGYPIIALSRAGSRKMIPVHKLVLEAFEGPCPPGMEARHLNDVADDNRRENLVWGTRLENVADKKRNGGEYQSLKTRCPRRHLLREPNLVPSILREGRRSCLACARTHSSCNKRGVPFDSALADAKYAQIMGENTRQ